MNKGATLWYTNKKKHLKTKSIGHCFTTSLGSSDFVQPSKYFFRIPSSHSCTIQSTHTSEIYGDWVLTKAAGLVKQVEIFRMHRGIQYLNYSLSSILYRGITISRFKGAAHHQPNHIKRVCTWRFQDEPRKVGTSSRHGMTLAAGFCEWIMISFPKRLCFLKWCHL